MQWRRDGGSRLLQTPHPHLSKSLLGEAKQVGEMGNGNASLGRHGEWAAGCEAPAPARPRARALPSVTMSCSLLALARLVTLLRAGRIPQRSVLWAKGEQPWLLGVTLVYLAASHPTLAFPAPLLLWLPKGHCVFTPELP